MKNIKDNGGLIAAIIGAVIILGGIILANNLSHTDKSSQDNTTKQAQAEKKTKKESSTTKSTPKTAKTTDSYTYTAQPGDSYTVLARKSVQAYAKSSHQKVSKAQIIAAETFLTTNANSPQLNVGQKVTLSSQAVAAAVKKAQALSQNDIAAWQTYVPYVNFDTSRNG